MVSHNASANAATAAHSRNPTQASMRYVLIFSVAFFLFIMGPPFLGYKFPPYPLMRIADVFDLFTPLVLIPMYWLLFRLDSNRTATARESLVFMVLAACFVLGQAMHLAANSIGHVIEGMAGTDVLRLTSMYDEALSHYLWHFGLMGLSAVIAFRQSRNNFEASRLDWRIPVAAVIYGFTFFAMVIEGVTWPMGLPFAAFFVAICLVFARKDLNRRPVLYFFLLAYAISLLLFAVWGIWQHGLPEFSKVGFIK